MILATVTVFLSAWLLFEMELIVAKCLMPWFGGTATVWTTCLLFFQTILLAGYVYAHQLATRLSRRTQGRVHLVLLLLTLAYLAYGVATGGEPFPFTAPAREAVIHRPLPSLLKLLIIMIGLPFMVLSATSSLMQKWFRAGFPSRSPYRLYAVSNASSLLALLTYPFLIEPWVDLTRQGFVWFILFGAFAVVCGFCALRLGTGPSMGRRVNAPAGQSRDGARGATVLLWLVLAACPSALLLSVTNELCREVAAVPFLWVVPLVLYLLSLILCFDHPRWYVRRAYVLLGAFVTVITLITTYLGVRLPIPRHVLSYSALLFCLAMICHGEMVRLKPDEKYLTAFYVAIASGGVLGSFFVAVAAPMLFTGYWELQVTILVAWIVLFAVFWQDKASLVFKGDPLHFFAIVYLAGYIGMNLLLRALPVRNTVLYPRWLTPLQVGGAFAAAIVVFVLARSRPFVHNRWWPRLVLGTLIFLAECFMLHRIRSTFVSTLDVSRNFYGVVRVHEKSTDDPRYHRIQLTHGRIDHGFQYTAPELRRVPTTYHSPSSGIGIALRHHARLGPPFGSESGGPAMAIGVTGLGVGALAAYARPCDNIVFYEINPRVIVLSAGPSARFRYLDDCRASTEIVSGDARISLEDELRRKGSRGFDVLALDAFSSDSVPVHLLTIEAFETYILHLRDEQSIIAVNISNRFVDFRPLMLGVARHFGMQLILIDSKGDPPVPYRSAWALLTRCTAFSENPEVRQRAAAVSSCKTTVWTDNYSNLFGLLRRF